ncbi:MAG: FISUMP domain-containing protein [Ignavibacteriota bacterium]
MKSLKLLALFACAVFFCQCKTSQTSEPSGAGRTLFEITKTLDTAQGKFREFSSAHPHSTPWQILQLVADWIRTQPNVKTVLFYDSAYLDIHLQSGLRAMYIINQYGTDSLSISRGGGKPVTSMKLTPTARANNVITNKNVLIFAPFVGKALGDLYHAGDLDHLVNVIKSSDHELKVTLLQNNECSVDAIASFSNYGLVIINTHGVPDGFITGHVFSGLDPIHDTDDVAVKEHLDSQMPDGFNKVKTGLFSFCVLENIANRTDWQDFLTVRSAGTYRLMANSTFISALPPMPNTVVFGNMCYSGWSLPGEVTLTDRGVFVVEFPIKAAFIGLHPISYYSYGYGDGRSAPVDNAFAKRMEDSLVYALTIRDDSTGRAYLNALGNEYTARQLGLAASQISPDMPLLHSESKDYGYNDCIKDFIDPRDGQKYKATCIGKQTWMAQNLNYDAPGSLCYDSTSANCSTYGKLYNWKTAMNSQPASSTNPSGVQGICPKGWHIPSEAEWMQAINFLGGLSVAGGSLKSTDASWNQPNIAATNMSGFAGLAGGQADSVNIITSLGLGDVAVFLSATDQPSHLSSVAFTLRKEVASVISGSSDIKTNFLSCRCLKD